MSKEAKSGFGRSATPPKKGAKKKKAGDEGEGEVERVSVVVRIRPQLHTSEGGADNMSLQVDPTRDMVWALPPDDDGKGKAPRQFVFDRVIPPDGKQGDVYDAVSPIVLSVLEGFTGCVMCYGQTGAGKTYTLANERAGPDAGVMIRAFTDIFDQINADPEHEYEVSMAFVQVYLEALSDLLQVKNDVEIREDANKGVFLTGLHWRVVRSVQDAKGVLADGNRNRATASTSMNADSSRSHAVLMMQVARKGGTRSLLGKLYLVDLAGSERVKKSGVEGQGLDEAISINQSLTTLGRCIETMARAKKGERPPFRESKLTRLLQNAIGGNAKTTLIVCVAPSKRDVVETNSSLEFGQQAMNVLVRAKVNASLDYGGLSSSLQEQLDSKHAGLRRLELRVLQQLAQGHEAALVLERSAKESHFELREAEADLRRTQAALKGAGADRDLALKEAEAAKAALLHERQEASAELARVMASLKDTPELRQVRSRQAEEKRSLSQQLADVQAELAAAEAVVKAKGGSVGGSSGSHGGGGGGGGGGEEGGLESEKDLLVGVAKNLGNLALHFVRSDSRSQASPLIVSAQQIFECVLGAGHPQLAEWKAAMFQKISLENSGGGSNGNGNEGESAHSEHAQQHAQQQQQQQQPAGFPVVRFLEAFASRSANPSAELAQITELLGSFSNPRPPARPGSLALDLSQLGKGTDRSTEDARRAARKQVLAILARPLREGDRPAEAEALSAVRSFFVEHGNGSDAIQAFHSLVFSARGGGGRSAIDAAQSYGTNYSPSFVRELLASFSARGVSSARTSVADGLGSASTTARQDEEDAETDALSKAEARRQLLTVAGTPRGHHLSAATPRNEQQAERALRQFMLAHGDGDEALAALQELISGAAAPAPSDAHPQGLHSRKQQEVRRIIAGPDADAELVQRRLDATSVLLQVAGTPRGGHISQQTPRDVRAAEGALQNFIAAHGGGGEGLAALQELMAVSAASKPPSKPSLARAQTPPPQAPSPVRPAASAPARETPPPQAPPPARPAASAPPRDPPAVSLQPPTRQLSGNSEALGLGAKKQPSPAKSHVAPAASLGRPGVAKVVPARSAR